MRHIYSPLLLLLATPVGGLVLRAGLTTARTAASLPRSNGCSLADAPKGGLRLLEWIPSQQLLVGTARFTWNTLWKTMISELAPQSPNGDYVRPAPQTGSGAQWPAGLPASTQRYHLYVGNPCPWCHRVSIARALYGQDAFSITRLADDPGRASRGGWCFDASDPDPLCNAKVHPPTPCTTPRPCKHTRNTLRDALAGS